MNPSAFPTAPTAPATGKRGPEAETKQNHAPSHTTITISKGGIFSWPTGGKVGWPLTPVHTCVPPCPHVRPTLSTRASHPVHTCVAPVLQRRPPCPHMRRAL